MEGFLGFLTLLSKELRWEEEAGSGEVVAQGRLFAPRLEGLQISCALHLIENTFETYFHHHTISVEKNQSVVENRVTQDLNKIFFPSMHKSLMNTDQLRNRKTFKNI